MASAKGSKRGVVRTASASGERTTGYRKGEETGGGVPSDRSRYLEQEVKTPSPLTRDG